MEDAVVSVADCSVSGRGENAAILRVTTAIGKGGESQLALCCAGTSIWSRRCILAGCRNIEAGAELKGVHPLAAPITRNRSRGDAKC